jgi:hypothetical protein
MLSRTVKSQPAFAARLPVHILPVTTELNFKFASSSANLASEYPSIIKNRKLLAFGSALQNIGSF